MRAGTETKGERTRRRIVDEAAALLNVRGYHAATLEELMAATGLRKGGIYNHFDSREDLVLAAYDRNVGVVAALLRSAFAEHRGAPERLHAFVEVYQRFVHEPPFPGGCPTLNGALQSRGTEPRLTERVRGVVHELLDDTVARIVRGGLRRGELRDGTDPDGVASVFVSSIEGALLLTELLGDATHIDHVAAHLHDYIDSIATSEELR
jgi:TetR/AcrR family transcriptional regulator, transcriptional repressor for nem operon